MKYLAFALLISVFSLGFLGLAFFGHGMDHEKGDCAAFLILGKGCPSELTGYALHHVANLQIFSRAVVTFIYDFSLILLFSVIFIFLFFNGAAKGILAFNLIRLFQRLHNLESLSQKIVRKYRAWLALSEYSPAF